MPVKPALSKLLTEMAEPKQVEFRLLRPHVALPSYATEQSACFDIQACLQTGMNIMSWSSKNEPCEYLLKEDRCLIQPGERYLIPTGWAVRCPTGYSLRLYSRSGLSLKSGLMLVNGVGIIDADYRHEVCMLLTNISRCAAWIENGMRVCQGEFAPMAVGFSTFQPIERSVTDEEWFTTQRTGGFGSTGVK